MEERLAIAQKDHPYSAYAHSLLNLMTGEDIDYTLPDMFELDRAEGRSSQKSESINVYPNPTQDRLNITSEGSDFLLGKTMIVMDFMGNRVLKRTIDELHEIVDMSSFSNGAYILIIKDDKKIIEKNVILKVY